MPVPNAVVGFLGRTCLSLNTCFCALRPSAALFPGRPATYRPRVPLRQSRMPPFMRPAVKPWFYSASFAREPAAAQRGLPRAQPQTPEPQVCPLLPDVISQLRLDSLVRMGSQTDRRRHPRRAIEPLRVEVELPGAYL